MSTRPTLDRATLERLLWRVVWDLGGEVTVPKEDPWREGREVIVLDFDDGELVVITDADGQDYEDKYPEG
jgi:hypothetical protein